MERGGGFYRYRRHAKQPPPPAPAPAPAPPSSCTSMSLVPANNIPNSTTANNIPNTINAINTNDSNPTAVLQGPQAPRQQQVAPHCIVREQDQYMPIANVIRIMRRILPAHAKISDDAKETIQECVSEYISFITGEANDRCQREQRKTITAEDVLWAMGKLGFDEYVEPLTLFLNRYRESENDRTSIRDPILKRSAVDYANVGMQQPYAPMYPTMGDQQGMFDPAALGGYQRDASGGAAAGGSSQNDLANFEPFARFK